MCVCVCVCVRVSMLSYTSSKIIIITPALLCVNRNPQWIVSFAVSHFSLSRSANLQHFSKRLSGDHTDMASVDILTTSVCFFSKSVLSSAGAGEGRRVSVRSLPAAQSSHQERPKALLFSLSSITSIGTAHLGWQ